MRLDQFKRILTEEPGPMGGVGLGEPMDSAEIERQAGSGLGLQGMTLSTDIAPYMKKMFSTPIRRDYINSKSLYKSRKRKRRKLRRRKGLLEVSDGHYEPLFSTQEQIYNAIIEIVVDDFDRRFDKMGFKTSIKRENGVKSIVFKTPSGIEHLIYQFHDHIVMAMNGAEIKFDPGIGVVCDDELFMAWSMPDDDLDNIWSVDTIAFKISSDCGSYILKCEAMRMVRPFVDLSVEPLDAGEIDHIREYFRIIPPKDYSGTYSNIGVYLSEHDGSLDDLTEAHAYYEPVNKWDRIFVKQNTEFIIEFLRDAKFQDKLPKRTGYGFTWGDNARLRMYPNVPWLFEVLCEGLGGNKQWCTMNVLPAMPPGMEHTYAKQIKSTIENASVLKASSGKWDNAWFLRRIWEDNIDEVNFVGGIAYKRDRQWGIDYHQSGYGGGALDPNYTSMSSVYWSIDDSGFMHFVMDSNVSDNAYGHSPGPATLNTWFHPDTDVLDIAKVIKRFSLAS